MKNFIAVLLFCNSFVHAQVFTQNPSDGAITITPNGIKGATNSGTNYSNIALGTNSLLSNTTGYQNNAIGFSSLKANTAGVYNTANGGYSLLANTIGNNNTANGGYALYTNDSGNDNTASGFLTLINVLSGNENTANGTSAGIKIVTGNSNTFLGFKADATDDYSNATAIGANATVNANNKVRIGDANVTVIEGQVSWSNPSDRRLKENIIYNQHLGLDFIIRLQPASYNYIADKNKTRFDGFIAQDVEKVMQDLNVSFSGLKKSADGMYSLAYSDFVMPLVNAVKEQQNTINELKNQNEILAKRIALLEELKAEILQLKTVNTNQFTTKK